MKSSVITYIFHVSSNWLFIRLLKMGNFLAGAMQLMEWKLRYQKFNEIIELLSKLIENFSFKYLDKKKKIKKLLETSLHQIPINLNTIFCMYPPKKYSNNKTINNCEETLNRLLEKQTSISLYYWEFQVTHSSFQKDSLKSQIYLMEFYFFFFIYQITK